MLTRIYIDNFLCFEKFEYKPERQQLIMGANGSGKSAFRDALSLIKQFVVDGRPAGDLFLPSYRTRWLNQSAQTFEIDAEWDGDEYRYRLVIEMDDERDPVRLEALHKNGRPELEFESGSVNIYWDHERTTHPRVGKTSAVGSTDTPDLAVFADRLANLSCIQINPFDMRSVATSRLPVQRDNLSDFATWYRHWGLRLGGQERVEALTQDLQEVLDRFAGLTLRPIPEGDEELVADFWRGDGETTFEKMRFNVNELSDGQRCLICLYAVLHFMVVRGGTVIIDEPENFISLREIQPWLMAADDIAMDHGGQILLMSHHPGLIDQWAPANGVQFVRDGVGPVRVERFRGDPESPLSASELVARGWEP